MKDEEEEGVLLQMLVCGDRWVSSQDPAVQVSGL